jgi:POT family proton-dependent oligopeptide transporter
MFKGHPKGLLIAFFANMGERFGFYTMMAILVLFLQAKFGKTAAEAGDIYSWFYFSIYGLALVGGLIADKMQNYKGVILIGLVIMFLGYALMSVPGMTEAITLTGLFTIALGNGLFKGNLQALVGQMYDDPKYSKLRDSAFSIFYMGINIGAFFAPSAASGIRSWFLSSKGFGYDPDLPALCHEVIKGQTSNLATIQTLADKVSGTHVTDLVAFANNYLNAFVTGYNYAFGIAAIAMIISTITFIIYKSKLPDRKKAVDKDSSVPTMSKAEEKQRLIALILVFIVVIFFWMSFHQNGLTMTFFARDYTVKAVDAFTYLFFDLKAFISIIAAIFGIVLLLGKNHKPQTKGIGALLLVAGSAVTYYFYSNYPALNPIEPEIFQQFNPIFIVFLTPVVVWFFSWLNKRGIEPSTPKKIGFGMILAALGFIVLLLGSFNLLSPSTLAGQPSPDRISVYWLINSYLILTVAELFLSPMGLSFVSKVAPPRFQGLMQGGWLGATAIGNKLLFIGSSLWVAINIWQVWGILVVCCLISALFIFSIMKKLENATK